MNKKSKSWKILFVSVLSVATLIAILVGQALSFLFGENYTHSPGFFSTYRNSGYYEIDPVSILGVLDQGETKVFTPYFGSQDRDEPYYENIAWSQADFLKIADAVSRETWNEPLDLESWQVIDLSLDRDCEDAPHGFHAFQLVYYKDKGIKKFERQYETRMIEMYAWQGLLRWGGGRIYSVPLLLWWKGININTFRITADDALQIAEDNGGLAVRQKAGNSCRILISATNGGDLFPPYQRDKWLVDYDRASYYMYIDPFTGKPR